ncbi:Serine/threonine-protein kinase RCK2 [Nakaseomyces glabratus]|nr:Serine/Threonine protein kinases active-site signature [Nakaseomyces glabratus]KTB17883.1 Serine/threonine-protein kinase RCK2 [Nakaseomyces glabratus]KTB22206.1 Serine/threonine-protein kinase RCK2 [Nakaseomyces glabratus]QNG13347.1 uncharacterized protein GWK60_F00517 [Nakaseomyces glabratus]SCV15173.1 uncharacterized protein CGFF_02730 [Nakaseomyces glabratus]
MSLYSYNSMSSSSFGNDTDDLSFNNPLYSDQTTIFRDGDLFKEQLDLRSPHFGNEIQFEEQEDLNNYRIISKIGEGAFSRVFKAVPLHNNLALPKFVAIKVVPKEDFHDHNLKKTSKLQTLNELNIHLKLTKANVPNVVKLLEFQVSKKYYYFIQEYIEGGEIFNQIVKYTYFSEDLTRHVIRQVATAVKGLHENNIIHRDIKPENLIFEPIIKEQTIHRYQKLRKSDDPKTKLDEGKFIPGIGGGGIGKVRLVDFGLSRLMDPAESGARTPCGTFGYLAPEVLNQYKVDPRTSNTSYSYKVDIWAIGCILYTMLCGFPPFYEDEYSKESLGDKISRGNYKFLAPWWDEISIEAQDLIRNLLQVDPAKRYDIDQLLAHPWLNHYDCETSRPESFYEAELLDKTHLNYVLTSQADRKTNAHQDKDILLFDLDDVSDYSTQSSPFDSSNGLNLHSTQKEQIRNFFNTATGIQQENFKVETEKATCNKSNFFKNHFKLKLSSATIINRRKKMKLQTD